MSFEVGAATYESATPRGRHRIATSFTKKHAYLFDLWDNPPSWYEVPATDLQPTIAKALVEAAEAGEADITAMVKRCAEGFGKLFAKSDTLFAGSGAVGAFATFPEPDRIEIGWIGYARVYRIGATVEALSRDHSLINEFRRQSPNATEEQLAEISPHDVTMRAIGMRLGPNEASSRADKPDVVACTLAPGEWLALVPRGITEEILGDSRLKKATTPDAIAKLIVALAIERDPNEPTGAIVIRRSAETAIAPGALAHELMARCPDRATESVIADWCEENGRREMVPWLLSDNGDVRANALNHLSCTLDSQERVTEAVFRSALRLFRALPAGPWLALAEQLISISPNVQEPPSVFFVIELRYDGPTPSHVRWAVAEELVDRILDAPWRPNERIVPLARIETRPCPHCGRTALVIAEDKLRMDGAGDPAWSTWVTALCMYEPHTSSLGIGGEWYERTSE